MRAGSGASRGRTARQAASAAALVAGLLAAAPAAAQQCGVPSATGQVTCAPAGNPYPAGVTYTLPGNLGIAIGTGTFVNGAVAGTSTGGTVSATNAGTVENGATLTAGGPGGVSVTNTGTFGLAGTAPAGLNGPAGLRVVASNGNAVVSGSGSYSSSVAGSPALSVTASGTATLTLGSVSAPGAQDAVVVAATGGSTVTLNGATLSVAGAAVRASGGAATVTNAATGVLSGGVVLTGGNDTFTNVGTFQALANSDFGAGTDTFNNSGVFRVRPNAGTVTTVTMTGLETFNNSGTVSLLNNRIGDRFVVPGAFVGSGASTVQLDIGANFTGTADVLQTGAATGTTIVQLNTPIGTGFTAAYGSGPVVIQAATGTSPTAFVLSPTQSGGGLVGFALAYDPAAFTFAVVGVPTIGVYRLGRVVEGQRAVWYRTSDTWSAHVASVRDALAAGATGGGRLWGAFDGSDHSRRGALGSTAFGVAQSFSTSYRQDAFEGVLGFDVLAPTADGGFSFGVMGGYTASTLRIVGSLDRVYYHVISGAAYASYSGGGFFVNATGRYQKSWNSLRSSAGFNTNAADADLYGAAAEAGFRFGGEKFFVEPLASIDYVHTKLDNFTALGAGISFDEDKGLRGKAGVRLGAPMPLGGNTATLYVSGQAVKEFKGRDRVSVTTGATGVTIEGDRPKIYGQGKAGFSVATVGGINGFIEGFVDYGDEYRGGGGRAGLAIKF